MKNRFLKILILLLLIISSLTLIFWIGHRGSGKSASTNYSTNSPGTSDQKIPPDKYFGNTSRTRYFKYPNRNQKSIPKKQLQSAINLSNQNIYIQTNNFPPTLKIIPVIAQIPAQTLRFGEQSLSIDLNSCIKNIDQLQDKISWKTNFNDHLTVELDTNGTAYVCRKDESWYGKDTIKFLTALQNSDSLVIPVEFAVYPFHKIPLLSSIEDQTITDGNKFLNINLISHLLDKGLSKEITWSVSDNRNLEVFIDSSGTASIDMPDRNWTGSDSITFRADGPFGLSDSKSAKFTVKQISFFNRQPIKPIGKALVTGVNDVFSLAVSPLHWDSSYFFIVPTVALGTYFLLVADQPLHRWISHDGNAKPNPIMDFGTLYGETIFTQVSALSIFSYGLLFNNSEAVTIGLEIFESYFIANNITSVFKRIFGRARPYENKGALSFDPFPSRPNPLNSLPSGHATLAFSLSSVLAAHTNNIFLKSLFYAAAGITSISRVYYSKHWFSDVFLGSAIGYLVGNYLVDRHNGIVDSNMKLGIDNEGRLSLSFNF